MNVQQTNLLKSSPNPHTKLLEDKTFPSVNSSFDKREDSADLPQRVFISEQEALGGSLRPENAQGLHKVQSQSQLEGLNPNFEAFYRAVLMITMLVSTCALLWTLFTSNPETKATPLDGLDLLLICLAVIQSIFAYQGFTKRDLQGIENAFNIMKITLLYAGTYLAYKLISTMKENQDKERSLDYGVLIYGILMIGLYVLLMFLPTRKVRNIFKLALLEEEKKLKKEGIEQLDSTTFMLFKYGHLIAACLEVKLLIFGLVEDFSNGAEILEKMISEWSFFAFMVKGYSLDLLWIFFNFFVFEGIRRKNLKKIEISTKLITIYLISFFSLNILEGIDLVWKHEKSFSKFYQEQANFIVCFFALFSFGAFRARRILRAHGGVRELRRFL